MDRLAISPGHAVGIDEPMIRELVHTFYASVRRDSVLGPIFDAAVDDWDDHLSRLCDFWSSVMLMTGRFHGSPMQKHAAVGAIHQDHFPHWLALFETTARDVCPPAAADLFTEKSRMIGRSLSLGLAVSRGDWLERLD